MREKLEDLRELKNLNEGRGPGRQKTSSDADNLDVSGDMGTGKNRKGSRDRSSTNRSSSANKPVVQHPLIEDVRATFGGDHPAYLFYVQLHPLLLGIGVSLFRRRQWLPRIVQISSDYGRIKILSDSKVVNESFIPVCNMRSMSIPDSTLRRLREVAEKKVQNSEATGGNFPLQLSILMTNGEPLLMQVTDISTFHLLTQAFKILCETPKEQLAYLAVLLGLGRS